MDSIALGANIKAAREAAGMTIKDAAGPVGVGVTYLRTIERGGNIPSVVVLMKLAKAYDTTVSKLTNVPDGNPGPEEPALAPEPPLIDVIGGIQDTLRYMQHPDHVTLTDLYNTLEHHRIQTIGDLKDALERPSGIQEPGSRGGLGI